MEKSKIAKMYDEMRNAIDAIAKKYGVLATRSNIRYSSTDMTFKVNLSILDPTTNKKVITDSAQAAARYALRGTGATTDEPLGKTYDFENIGKATIIEFNSKCYKYPFVVETPTGKRWKVSARSVALASKYGNHWNN